MVNMSSGQTETLYVTAKYDYTAAHGSDELNIKRNEKLLLLDNSRNWWKVKNSSSQEGFVPSNYVKVSKKTGFFSNIRNTLGRKKSVDHSGASGTTRHGMSDHDNGETLPLQSCDMIPRIAKYAYTSQQHDEITLNKGEIHGMRNYNKNV